MSRRAPAGNAGCSALSSWRQTTSGCAVRSQVMRLCRRLLMLLMLKVAIFNGRPHAKNHFGTRSQAVVLRIALKNLDLRRKIRHKDVFLFEMFSEGMGINFHQ